jgi:hypothetical protein
MKVQKQGSYFNHSAEETMIQRVILSILAVLAMLAQAGAQPPKGSSGERTSVDLTIYNQNLSLIREERPFTFPRGMGQVVVPDIPATIDGTSVHFMSLTDPLAVRVLEQNYQYDLVSQGKLLERYLGKQVEWVRVDPATNKEYSVFGRLLSTGYAPQPGYGGAYAGIGGMVAEINGKIELNPAGRMILPALPDGLVLRPQLSWLVSNTREGSHRAEISYLAGGLSWSSNYVALLDNSDAALDLTGWVTLTNTSGTTFRNAGLKLVAGDVNVVQNQFAGAMKAMRTELAEDAAAPQFRQTNLFEFKLYSLQRRTDVGENETKQIELVSGRGVAAKKSFIYDGMADQWRSFYRNASYSSQGSFGQQSNPKVGVYVTFKNVEKSGLGIPLPKGKVRVYKRDDDGREQFIGEDEIDHTPKDEEVRLYLGNAFDLVGERAQKDFKTYAGGHVVEETIEVKVRNHKDAPADVLVYEHPWRWSQWEIISSSAEWTKVDQTTLKFPVRVAANGEKIVKYTIRYSW